jgi:hypothetical protein
MNHAITDSDGSSRAEVTCTKGAFRQRHTVKVGLGLWVAVGALAVEWQGVGVESMGGSLVPGRFGQALNAAHGGFLAPGDVRFGQCPVTVELWAQIHGSGERVLIANGLRGSKGYWELSVLDDGRFAAAFAGFEPSVLVTDRSLRATHWHHLAMVLEADRVRLYVDAELAGSTRVRLRPGAEPVGAMALGTRVEERRPSAVLLDDVRVSAGVREILEVPRQPLVADRVTVGLWSFEESEEEYLAQWTPGGETNQRGLPYPHRVAEYEFESDDDWVDGRWQETRKGPFVTHSTRIPGFEVGVKTATVFLGEDESGAVLFDLERCAPTAGLAEPRFRTDPARFGLLRKPQLEGRMQFHLPPAKAWRLGSASAGDGLGRPLERGEVQYRGLYLQEARVLFRFEVLGGTVLDSSWVESRGPVIAIRRSIETSGVGGDVALTLTEMPVEPQWWEEDGLRVAWCDNDGERMAVALPGTGAEGLAAQGRDVLIKLSESMPATVTWLCWTGPGSDWSAFLDLARRMETEERLARLQEPGGRLWGEPLVTRGHLGEEPGAPYVIDTITVPYENPYRALFFIGALDFFPNGDAALCTTHGDVWVVRGLNNALEHVTWQRFATGLYQPLGLRVVENQVIVLGRDQLTRLHDRNGSGEADYYETFNQDLEIQGHDHAYAARLEIDSRGDLFFLKSGGGPHGSAVLKVSRDGSRLDVVARGFRHPYGMGMGPGDELTVADNEGNWVPSSKIDWVRPGGFYGFLGGLQQAPERVVPEPPLCYIPKVADNSSGGQIWVSGDRWGAYHRGQMLHLSWGRCTLHAVLRERVGEVWQAATVRFPGLTFLSGPGEGRFHPVDGQLYVVGLAGWQTGAAADGSFQRVRFTGADVLMPEAFHVHANGIRVRFTQPLDVTSASDPASFRIEQWNYQWSATYGSFHYSVRRPGEIGHDKLRVESSHLLPDRRTVFLAVSGLEPVDQIHVHVNVRASDGRPLRFDL